MPTFNKPYINVKIEAEDVEKRLFLRYFDKELKVYSKDLKFENILEHNKIEPIVTYIEEGLQKVGEYVRGKILLGVLWTVTDLCKPNKFVVNCSLSYKNPKIVYRYSISLSNGLYEFKFYVPDKKKLYILIINENRFDKKKWLVKNREDRDKLANFFSGVSRYILINRSTQSLILHNDRFPDIKIFDKKRKHLGIEKYILP